MVRLQLLLLLLLLILLLLRRKPSSLSSILQGWVSIAPRRLSGIDRIIIVPLAVLVAVGVFGAPCSRAVDTVVGCVTVVVGIVARVVVEEEEEDGRATEEDKASFALSAS